ncbi:MAG: S41 family peptidase, partial [Lachnospiraceae bacterium]|nr:S41 family peptidase [Lachnospiraceae bacterium]
MHKKRKMCLTVAVIILGGSLWLGGCVKTEEKQTEAESEASQTEIKESEEASLLNEAVQGKAEKIENIIDQYFLFEKDEDMMEEGLYAGIMAGLGDPYSVYYTREQYADLMESTTGAYCGIGALVSQDPNTGMVSAVRIFSGTPAEEAGMLPGDVIVAVDGMDVTGIDLDLLVSQYVKGEEGTLVVITVWRQSENEYLELDITRRVVEIPTVESRMLEDQIGYVAVSQFDQVTGKQFASEVEALEGQGMTSLIVDLRGNPGGTLDSVVEMMDYILPDHIPNYARGTDSTTLIYTENKNGDGDSYSAND